MEPAIHRRSTRITGGALPPTAFGAALSRRRVQTIAGETDTTPAPPRVAGRDEEPRRTASGAESEERSEALRLHAAEEDRAEAERSSASTGIKPPTVAACPERAAINCNGESTPVRA
jgi:hypothetical protein